MTQVNITMDALGLVIAAIMLYSCFNENVTPKKQRQYFLSILLALMVILLTDLIDWAVDRNASLSMVNFVSNSINYCAGYLIVVFFARYLNEHIMLPGKIMSTMIKVFDVMCAVSVGLVFINIFNQMYFAIDSTGLYIRGSWWLLSQIFPLIALVSNGIVILVGDGLSMQDRIIFLTHPMLPLIGIIINVLWPGWSFSFTGALLSATVVYMQIYIVRSRQVSEQKAALQQKAAELAETRVDIMLSQIQPHFIYNTLGTISHLCRTQPEKAAELVQDFALYLRGSLGELENRAPIRVSREIEHVKHYTNIEKVRFPDMNVEFDLQANEFFLPALTIQPLVENSIKHGLMGLESGGTVEVSTYETENAYCICVKDDGVGYDTSAPMDEKHIGIRNIRGRLEMMCDGTLTVESKPGEGTVALITIPKGEGALGCNYSGR